MLDIQFPHDIYYIGFGLIMFLLVVSLVPREGIRRLFGISIIWGYLGSFVFIAFFSSLLNLFAWQETAFTFFGSPIIINLAWALALLIYLYFLPKSKHLFWLYLLTFSLISVGLDTVFNQLGILQYISWGLTARFAVSVAWFLGASFHLNYISKSDNT